MKIGIVGSGNVGSGLGKRLAAAGHEICFSYSRDMGKLAQLAQSVGANARTGTPQEAAAWADVVLLATGWGQVEDAATQIREAVGTKILWTTVNPLKPDMSGLAIGTTTSGAEAIAALLPNARIVEAIACNAEILHSPSLDFGGDRPATFVCGDDADARAIVGKLMQDVGLAVTDAGALYAARLIEPSSYFIAYLGYSVGLGGNNVAAKLLRRES